MLLIDCLSVIKCGIYFDNPNDEDTVILLHIVQHTLVRWLETY